MDSVLDRDIHVSRRRFFVEHRLDLYSTHGTGKNVQKYIKIRRGLKGITKLGGKESHPIRLTCCCENEIEGRVQAKIGANFGVT